jgi:outer membrane receptor protein involved in Fe transport
MKKYRPCAKSAVAIAAALTLLPVAGAWAQSAANDGTLNLDTVVVTGVAQSGSKMKQSIAVSTVDSESILAAQPQNASDVLASIPGLMVQSSGGAGNANVSVRGLPISAGGSRYLQFQEDGLPVLLFGDIAFGTPDDFLRVDSTLDRVEAVRGGTGSTLTTNGPGGIVNYISKTGAEQGGSVGLTTGVGYKDERFDFNYGGKLGDKTHYFIGGYFEQGQGPRQDSSTAIEGGQIKGNITQDLDNGFIRFSFKHLSDQQPLYMPAPVNVSNGQISTIAGIDPRTYTGYSAYMPTDTVVTPNGTKTNLVNSGLTTNVDSYGVEGEFRLGNGWTLNDKFRTAANSGNWLGFFPGSAVSNAAAGTTYATGPNAGQSYTGAAFQNVAFDVSVNNLGNTTNDAKIYKTFDLSDGAKLTTTAGLFLNVQHVNLTWNFNTYLMQATGSNPALLKNSTTNNYGLIGPGFGGCCSRDIDATYNTTSPYGVVSYEKGALTLDASLRLDNQSASGYYNAATESNNTMSYSPAGAVAIDYSVHHTEYSVGANYLLDKNTALFARVSSGAAFNADRIMFNGPLSGSTPIPINTVQQYEGGIKLKTGNLSSFITLFDAKTSESNYSATLQQQSANQYEAKGVEIEEGYRLGHFHLSAGATITDSTTTTSTTASLVGQPANRQAKVVYQAGPSYIDEKFDVGFNITGTSKAPEVDELPSSPVVWMPAYTLVNMHANYMFDPHTSVSFGVYNLFNTLAYTEVDGLTSARALNGRNARLTLKYAF